MPIILETSFLIWNMSLKGRYVPCVLRPLVEANTIAPKGTPSP